MVLLVRTSADKAERSGTEQSKRRGSRNKLASIADAEEMPSPPSFPYPSLLVPVLLLLLLLLLFLLCMSFILLLLAAAAED